MKKNIKQSIVALLIFNASFLIGQTNISPQLINSTGGWGVVSGVYYDYSVGEPITLFGGTGCDSIFSGFQHCAVDTLRIKHLPLAIGSAATSTTICQGQHVVLTAPAGTTYVWYPGGATTQTYSVTNSGTYHVRVTNSCGDTASSNPVVVTVLSPPTPAICQVSTDSTTNYQYNTIYWQNNVFPRVDSFIVYRYSVTQGHYVRIGAVSHDSLSEYKDVDSTLGDPHGGNPAYNSWKYKLAIKDSCGNISSLSPYHQTVFVQQTGQNFSWTVYIDSLHTSLPNGYGLYRDTTGTGNYYREISATTGTNATDPNYASYPSAVYRVDAIGFNCNPTYRLAGNNSTLAQRVKSHSNVNNNRFATTGIQQVFGNQVMIYPNPASTSLQITSTNMELTQLQISDVLGNELMQITMQQGKASIDVSMLTSGVYFVRIGSSTQKFVKQ